MPSSVFDPTVIGQRGGAVHDRSDPGHRARAAQAVRLIEAGLQRSADTHPYRAAVRELQADGTWSEPPVSNDRAGVLR